MIIRKHLAVLEDLNGNTVLSLVGDMEFIFNSVKQSIQEFLKDNDQAQLHALIENGSLVLTRHYLEYIHDNTPMNNFALAIDKKVVFGVEYILKTDFASREYCVAFDNQLKDFVKINEKLLEKYHLKVGGNNGDKEQIQG